MTAMRLNSGRGASICTKDRKLVSVTVKGVIWLAKATKAAEKRGEEGRGESHRLATTE
jgi:hypothetical protein